MRTLLWQCCPNWLNLESTVSKNDCLLCSDRQDSSQSADNHRAAIDSERHYLSNGGGALENPGGRKPTNLSANGGGFIDSDSGPAWTLLRPHPQR